jgi:hypothetical protein
MGSSSLKDQVVENLKPMKVRAIGAGYCGIYLGVRNPQKLRNIDLVVMKRMQESEVFGG